MPLSRAWSISPAEHTFHSMIFYQWTFAVWLIGLAKKKKKHPLTSPDLPTWARARTQLFKFRPWFPFRNCPFPVHRHTNFSSPLRLNFRPWDLHAENERRKIFPTFPHRHRHNLPQARWQPWTRHGWRLFFHAILDAHAGKFVAATCPHTEQAGFSCPTLDGRVESRIFAYFARSRRTQTEVKNKIPRLWRAGARARRSTRDEHWVDEMILRVRARFNEDEHVVLRYRSSPQGVEFHFSKHGFVCDQLWTESHARGGVFGGFKLSSENQLSIRTRWRGGLVVSRDDTVT